MTVIAEEENEGAAPSRADVIGESITGLLDMYKRSKEYLEACRNTVAKKQEALKAAIADLTAKWDEENAADVKAYENAKAAFDTTEMNLRAEAVEYYRETGNKTFNENVGVQVRKSLEYEMAKAVKWAEVNAPIMIVKSVDKKPFETLAETQDLDFVKKIEKVSAVLKGV